MLQEDNADVAAIREWLAKEPHLPQDFDDFVLKKFLHSCYGSLERTKECIERFCSTRTLLPELYTSRDPSAPAQQTTFSITNMTSIECDGYDVMFHQINDPGLEKFVFYDVAKAFGIISDYHLQHINSFPEKHIIVIDMKDYTLKIIPKVNLIVLRHFMLFLLDTFPLRVKKVYVVNSPSYYDTLYALIKPVLPNELRELISFHLDAECLQKLISKDRLPKDFGGEGPSLYEMQRERLKDILSAREWYLDDTRWKTNLQKKSKNTIVGAMTGSFRTLCID